MTDDHKNPGYVLFIKMLMNITSTNIIISTLAYKEVLVRVGVDGSCRLSGFRHVEVGSSGTLPNKPKLYLVKKVNRVTTSIQIPIHGLDETPGGKAEPSR